MGFPRDFGLKAGLPWVALVFALWLPGHSQTSSPLASHWGAADYPEFKRGFQSGMTFLSFTEYDSDHHRFGETAGRAGRASGQADGPGAEPPYPESMGFNFLSLAYGNHVNSQSSELANMMYRYTASLGLNADQFTEFYQNRVIHQGYRDIPTVPRDRVRCQDPLRLGCAEFALGGEILYRFTNIELEDKLKFHQSNFFVGVGTSLGTPLLEGYVELGISQLPTLVTTEYLGLRVAGMIRVGGNLQPPFGGTKPPAACKI